MHDAATEVVGFGVIDMLPCGPLLLVVAGGLAFVAEFLDAVVEVFITSAIPVVVVVVAAIRGCSLSASSRPRDPCNDTPVWDRSS